MTAPLAQRTRQIDASGIRKVFALAAGLEDPVNFSIGQPDFDVPDPIKQAAVEAILKGNNRYSQTAGDEILRSAIRDQLQDELGWQPAPVLVTSGVSGGLLLAFLALIDPGDEVIVPDPYFVIYKHVIHMLGGKCVFVNSYPDFSLPLEGIRNRITERTKLIIVNSPCNPTGRLYPAADLAALAEIAAQRKIIVLSDEIYRDFTYDDACPSMAAHYDRTLLLRGFSKAYAMTGWRMGYVTAHPCLADVLEAMTMIQQYTFVCAPTPFQQAALVAMTIDMTPYVTAYRQKRDCLLKGLQDTFEVTPPEGAFYAFVKVPGGTATDFVAQAIANNVLVIPGNVFSEQDTHFRISFATSEDKIQQGTEILRRMAQA
jgi:aspartate aminotransferase/aminotransferase